MNTPFHVLSLEDSDLDFEIISEQLIKAGYNLNISRAETEKEFTSLVSNNRYDIILADYNLPQFDAFEALKICNRHCPEVPFICVSGSIGEITAIELLKMGAVDYVLKDRLERLPFAVKRALEEASEKKTRIQMEESLRQSEEKYRTIFENVQDVFYQTDLAGIIREISPSIKHFSDFNTVELVGKPVIEIYYNPDDRIKLIQLLNERGEVRDYEIRLKTKKDEVKYASINARLIFDSEGIPDHIDGALRDITKRKQAEESLKHSEERLRDIIFTTADWVWEVDENGVYTYSSLKGNELFDIGAQSILGKTPFDFMPEEEAKRVAPIFAEIVAKREPIKDLENWNIGKNGELICLLTNGLPVFNDEGRLIGYRGIDKNITERKQAELELIAAKEKAEASDKLKTAFMNNISHEIRTPLNGILGFGQILADREFPADEKEGYFKMLEDSSDRLLNTITNIIDISLLTSGNLKINKEEFNLDRLIRDIYEKFDYTCSQKDLVFSIQKKHAENGKRICTDESLLNKILSQLIDNSIKFTSSGTIVLSYNIKGNALLISVKDSGIGISEKNKSQIFDNFMQEDNDNTRKYEGSGIGLSIVKGLTEILGGSISLESEKGKGSTFTLSIPIN